MRLSAMQRQGWLLLAARFVTFAVGAACMHSYTVFLIAFIEAFGWSRGRKLHRLFGVADGHRRHFAVVGCWSTGWGRGGLC